MHVVPDKKKGVLRLTSGNDVEEAMLRRMSKKKKGFLLKYNGRGGADNNDPLTERMSLYFIFEKKEVIITGTSTKSELPIRLTRDAIFFGGGSLILVKTSRTEKNKIAIDVCVAHCEHCKATLIDPRNCEGKICEKCVLKCQHEYTAGIVHGGKVGLGIGEYCVKCMRGKPDSTPVSLGAGKILILSV